MKEKTNISNHIINAFKDVIKDFFIVIFIVVIPLFISLTTGIKIDTLSLYDYKIEGLYIKLDKKFILKAQKIHIPKTKAKPSFGSVEKTFNNIKEVLSYFEYIELNDVEFKNNNLTILYSSDILYISTKEYAISSIVHKKKNKIIATITNLHINKSNIDINGTLSYNLKNDILKTQGNFFFLDSNGSFSMQKDKNILSLSLKSSHFTRLNQLLKPWKIPQNINLWIENKVKAKRYKLDNFSISALLDNNATIVPNLHSIKAKATLNDVDIYFKKGLKSIKSKQVQIIYQDNQISFVLDKPKYKGRDLDGSKVVIKNVIGDIPPKLNINLFVHSKIDSIVHEILHAYHVSLPLITTTKQSFHIILDRSLYHGDDLKVYIESNLSKGRFYISKIPLDITSGYISMKGNIISLSNIKLQNSIYNIISNGTIDTNKKTIKLQNNILSMVVKQKSQKIFSMHKLKLPIYMRYGKKFSIDIPTLSLKSQTYKHQTSIHIYNLSKLLPYIKNLPLKLLGGKLEVSTNDFQKYNFNGTLKWNECFLYKNNSSCLSYIPCKGVVNKNDIVLYAFGKKLYINDKKSVIKLNRLNIDIDKFFQTSFKNISKHKKKVYIYGNNSTIRYQEYHLLTDSYDITMYPNGNIKAIGSLDKDIVKFDKKGKNISIKAYRVKDKMLHPLINFKGLKHGRYTIKVKGNPNKKLKGEILVEGGVLKDFKAYNNTLAFINSIPALATFSNPGFSDKGYIIKEGMIEYIKYKDKLYLDSIYIKGSSANIAGKGIINLKTKAIDISLAVQVAKDFSKVISKIPLVGYILMGKDKNMTLGLKITGNLNKPIVKTSVAKDILSLPFKMLARTFGATL